MTAGVAVAGFLALGGLATAATAASAATIGKCSSQGEFALCTASGTANNPVILTVTVTASPNQTIDANWNMVCSKGSSAAGSSGSFKAKTPVTRKMPFPFAHPDSCDVAALGALDDGSGHIHVAIASTLPPHPIRGLDGKCVDDPANGSANGTRIEIWSCNKTAAQNWAFSGGQLRHNGKCATEGSGGTVLLHTCSTGTIDLWTHKPNREYVLRAHGSTLCLTDPRSSTRNGTKLVVSRCKDTANQRWSLP